MGFCVKCGKKGIKGSLCEDCAKEENPLLKEFKETEVDVCKICNAYRFQGRWIDAKTVREGVEKNVAESIKKSGTVPPKINIKFPKPVEDLKKERGKKHLEAELVFPDEEYTIPAHLTFTECPRCSKRKSAYFEAILQLRNPRPEIIDFINHRLEMKAKTGIFVTDIKEVTNGVDFYITEKRYAVHLGKILQKKFFGIFKISAKVFSKDRDTQRDIHRVNVLFKVLDLNKGDIVTMGEDKVKILDARGERIQGMVMKNRKKIFVDLEQIR